MTDPCEGYVSREDKAFTTPFTSFWIAPLLRSSRKKAGRQHRSLPDRISGGLHKDRVYTFHYPEGTERAPTGSD